MSEINPPIDDVIPGDMAGQTVTVTKQVAELRELFNKVSSVGFVSDADLLPSALTTVDFMLPILEGSITFDTGEPSIETVNLTTGEKWTTMTTAGEPNITMNCSSFIADIRDLFLNKVTSSDVTLDGLEGKNYKGDGYNLEAKKVVGGLLMRSEDRGFVIYMPHVEIYSSIGIEENTPGYFNMKCTPLASSTDSVAIYFLTEYTSS